MHKQKGKFEREREKEREQKATFYMLYRNPSGQKPISGVAHRSQSM